MLELIKYAFNLCFVEEWLKLLIFYVLQNLYPTWRTLQCHFYAFQINYIVILCRALKIPRLIKVQ